MVGEQTRIDLGLDRNAHLLAEQWRALPGVASVYRGGGRAALAPGGRRQHPHAAALRLGPGRRRPDHQDRPGRAEPGDGVPAPHRPRPPRLGRAWRPRAPSRHSLEGPAARLPQLRGPGHDARGPAAAGRRHRRGLRLRQQFSVSPVKTVVVNQDAAAAGARRRAGGRRPAPPSRPPSPARNSPNCSP